MTNTGPSLDKLLAEEFNMLLPQDTTPERQLWHAVILQAIEDATVKQSTSKSTNHLRFSAQDWFYQGGFDFQRVCELAGLEAEQVQWAALDCITRPDTGWKKRKRRQQSLKMVA